MQSEEEYETLKIIADNFLPKGGHLWQYDDIPVSILLFADSLGKFMIEQITESRMEGNPQGVLDAPQSYLMAAFYTGYRFALGGHEIKTPTLTRLCECD